MKLFNVRLGVLFLVLFSFVFPAIGFGAETVPSPGYLDLDGSRYVKIPKSDDFAIPAGGTMTITMKVKQNYPEEKGNLQSFVSTIALNKGQREGFEIYNQLSGSSFKSSFYFYASKSDFYTYYALFNSPNANFSSEECRYVHIAIVFDGAKSTKSDIYLYSNGIPMGNKTMGKLKIPILKDLILGARYLCTNGNDSSGTEFEHFFNGQIDDLRFYRAVLSEDEIKLDMNSDTPIPDKKILAAYDFSDLSNGVVRDVSGKGHHGELMGNWPTYGPPSQEAEPSYTVNIEQNEHADISLSVGGQPLVSGTKVEKGTAVSVAVTPHEGYELECIKVNGAAIEGNTFEVKDDCNVSVSVKEKAVEKFKVEYSAEGQGTITVKNGEVSIPPGGEVDKGVTLSCVVAPADGYSLKSLTVNGIETKPDTDGKFTVEVTGNIEIKAVFDKMEPTVTKYKVTIEKVDHIKIILKDRKSGEEIASGSEVASGTEIKVETVIVDSYELTGIYVNGNEIVGSSFIVTEESVVKAEVRPKVGGSVNYTVRILGVSFARFSVFDEAGNKITDKTSVPAGTKLRVDVTPDEGYYLDCIKVNGEPIEGNTFIVEGDGTISVVIKEKTATEKFKVEYSTAGGGSLTVKNGDVEVASGDEVEKGTTLTCQVSATDGYKLKTLTVNEVEMPTDAAGKFTVQVNEALVIKAVFEKEPSEFTVTIEQVENVSITLSAESIGEIESGSAVAEGTVVTVTAISADGYEVEGICVNDIPIQGLTFTVRGDCRVRAVVKEKEAPPVMYAVTVRTQPNVTVTLADKDGNEISAGTLLPEGTVVKVSAIAAEGYELAGIYLNGAPLEGDTFTVSELSEVYAVAKAVEPTQFTVNFSTSGGGAVNATVDGNPVLAGDKVESGKTLVITCEAADGYMLGSISVNSRSVTLGAEDRIETIVDSDMDIEVDFREPKNVYFSVRALAAEHVTVRITDYKEPPLVDRGALQEGSKVTVLPTPDEGYEVEGIYVNGEKLHGDSFTVRRLSEIEVKVRKAEGETPEIAKYAVKVTEQENVTVKLTDDSGNEIVSGTTLPVGTLVTVTATPAEGYELEGIYVNNVKLTGVNFTLTGESTVEAKVRPKSPAIVKYTVTILEQENVTVTLKGDDDATIPSGTSLSEGTVVTVMATPASGYELEGIYLNGEKLDKNTFAVAGESEIKAIVKKAPTGKEKYAVKVLAQSNVSVRLFDESGTIIPSGTPVLEGTVVTVEVKPDDGYELEGIYRNDAKLDGNTFVVAGESVIKAIVRAAPPVEPSVTKYVVTIEQSRNGTIMLSDEEGTRLESGSAVAEGTLVLIAAVADYGYKLAAVTLNQEVIAADRFTVTGDTEVGAIFEVDPAASGDEPSVPEKVVVSYSSVGPGTVSVVSGDGAIASGSEVEKDSEITLVCEPHAGARLAALKVTGAEVPADFDGRAVIVAGRDIEIKVEFAMINYTLTVTESGRGHAAIYGNVDAAGVPAGDAMAGGSVIHYGDVLHLFAVPDKGYTLISAAVNNNGVTTVLSVDEDFTQRADGSHYKAIPAEGDVMIELRFSTVSSGIDSTRNDGSRSRYYNLHGIEIPADRLSPGIYIMIDGAVKKKILIR